jgi:RNA polymerase sigma-70 factor, ECF subfamily
LSRTFCHHLFCSSLSQHYDHVKPTTRPYRSTGIESSTSERSDKHSDEHSDKHSDERANEKNERFMRLLEPCHDRLARFARAMTNSHEDAEDLLSDTILLAYEKFDTIREPQAFLGWLFTVASRLHKRRRWRASLFQPFERLSAHAGTRDDEASYEWEPPSQGASATSAPDVFVDVNLLYAALERLPSKQREAFVLFEITGLSLVEIQEVQGDSLSSVKMRLARARERLLDLLGGNAGGSVSSNAEQLNAKKSTADTNKAGKSDKSDKSDKSSAAPETPTIHRIANMT